MNIIQTQNKPPVPPAVVYHYCSLSSFYNIVRSKTLRFMSAFYSNDFLEGKDILNILNQTIRNLPLSDYERKNIMDGVTLAQINISPTYIISFSELQDNLGQWRGYADEGKGVAIGFQSKFFSSFSPSPHRYQIPLTDESCGFMKILYDDESKKAFINTIIQSMISATPFEKNSSAIFLAHMACIFKHPSFTEEKEWRLVFLPFEHPSILQEKYENNKKINPNIQYINRNNRIVPFYELNLTKDAFAHIILGPKNPSSEYDISNFLISNQLGNIPIYRSRAPYI